ncbi:MAG: hypothetical protein JJU06_05760 [Ectothiorhodospiraceae bacterium]|nr:hypothetical protein [Ectothiorhodospiraceae bacterium]MCH8502919.1 hypothetical protein [Ectothiorhodospiraceae bacterium]
MTRPDPISTVEATLDRLRQQHLVLEFDWLSNAMTVEDLFAVGTAGYVHLGAKRNRDAIPDAAVATAYQELWVTLVVVRENAQQPVEANAWPHQKAVMKALNGWKPPEVHRPMRWVEDPAPEFRVAGGAFHHVFLYPVHIGGPNQ